VPSRRPPRHVGAGALLGVIIAAVVVVAGLRPAHAASYSQTIVGDAPSFYYRLDETGGPTLADSSGNGHNAAYGSGISFSQSGALAGDSDTAVAPNGNIGGTYSSGSGEPTGSAARTVEGWVRTVEDGNNQDVVSWGSQNTTRGAFSLTLGVTGSGTGGYIGEQVGSNDQWWHSPQSFKDGNWHLFDVTYDGNVTLTAYLDGQSLGTQSLSAPLNTQSSALDIGGSVWCGCDAIRNTSNGLDEVAVYPTALSGTQVAAHFAATGNTVPTAPTNVIATAGGNQVAVSWTASTATVPTGETAVQGYVVTAYNGSTAANSTSVPASTTSATLDGLRGGVAYSVQVTGSNAFGSGTAGVSGTVTPSGASTTYASGVLGDGAVAYYRLDDSGPLLADSAGGHNAAAGAGMTRGISGAVTDDDGALAPNGVVAGSNGATGTIPMGSAARTVEGWVRTADNSANQDLVSWGSQNVTRGAFNLSLGVVGAEGGQWIGEQVGSNDQWWHALPAFKDGNWHLLDMTYDGNVTLTAYLDGQSLGSKTLAGRLNTQSTALDIGGSVWCSCDAFRNTNNGLDDVAVYATALTSTQVAAHFAASGNTVPTAPTNVTATAGANQATMSWTASTATVPAGETAVQGYVVTAYDGSTPANSTSVPASATTATLDGLRGGVPYSVRVTGFNAFGSGNAGVSGTVTPSGAATTYASGVLDDGASTYYRLDDVGPLLADSAGAHHAAAGVGMTRGITGGVLTDGDGALAPNGTVAGASDVTSTVPMGAAPRTVEGWVRTVDDTANQDLVSWGSQNTTRGAFSLTLGVTGNGTGGYIGEQVGSDDQWWHAPQSFKDGNWHLLDITYDGGLTLTAYLDGKSLGTKTLGGALNTQSTTALDIGGSIWCGCDAIRNANNGLDDVALYPTDLNAAQISNHYYAAGYTVATAPSPPQNVRGLAGPGSMTVTWDAPAQLNGGGPVTAYTVRVFRPTPVTYTVPPGLRRVQVPGLSAGTSYQAAVSATNATASSPWSAPSAALTTSALPGSRGLASLQVYLGYADGLRGSGQYPSPWYGSPGVTFVGSSGVVDGGAIRLVNPTASAITIDSASIDVGSSHFGTWGSGLVVPSNGSLILAPTGGTDMDTSDTWSGTCVNDGLIPQVHLTSGSVTRTYADTGQVLNTTGLDIASCPTGTNEASKWVAVGSVPISVCGCWKAPTRADPIDTSTGGFAHTFSDFSIPARGYPLAVTRTYSSLQAGYDGPFGFGWSADFPMSLVADPGAGDGAVTIWQEDGSPVTFTLKSGVYVAPPQVLATFTDNGDGTFIFTRNRRERLVFSGNGELLRHSDLNGETTTYAYDANGRIGSIADAAGRTLTVTYDANNHVTKVVDSTSRQVSYSYDASGNLSSATDVNGGVSSFTYDANHQLLAMTDPRNGTVTNVYDTSGRVTKQTDALGRATTFSYTGTTTTVTDPLGHVEVDTFQNGLLVSKSVGSGAATWSYTYDPTTLAIATVTDPNSHTTTNTYDSHGDLLTTTDALHHTSTYTYDALGDQTTATDPNGVTTTYTYDASGNLLTRSRPLVGASSAQTQTVTYHHDNSTHPGDVTSIADPAGKTTAYAYDPYGDQTGATDPLGNTATTTYNTIGWVSGTVSPKGNVSGCGCVSQYTTTYSYADPQTGAVNEFGDVRVVTDPLGHTVTRSYDADRNLVSVTDGDDRTTATSYDLDNEPTATTRADGSLTTTDFNADGTVLDEKDGTGNAILTFGYDSLGRQTSSTDALGNVTAYTYDAADNLLTRQDPGGNCSAVPASGCTTVGYDGANRVTGITYSDGSTPGVTGITYDADGQRTGMSDGTGAWSWQYDSLHRLTSVTEGSNGTLTYQYDLRNLVTQVTYPGGHTVGRGYDAAGTTDWLGNTVQFGYDPNTNLVSETFPANAAGTYDQDAFSFNAADQMTATDVAQTVPPQSPVTLASSSYTRDGNGQLISDSSQPPQNGSFAYTALNQLCDAGPSGAAACTSPAPGSTAYTFDAADNLIQDTITQQAFNAADQLCWTLAGNTSTNPCSTAPTGATTYAYDTRGNRTTTTPSAGTPTAYGYDQANRLTSLAQGTSAATYTYNGDGLRMSKTVNGTSEAFAWDLASGLPLAIADGSTQYVYGPGGLPLEQANGSAVLYYHHDQLGSTRELTDGNGLIQATYTYDPYGNLTASTGSIANPLLYAGQFHDAEAGGLYYLRARYYDPITAQFLTRDPLVAKTRSPYAYVQDNPLNVVDLTGLDAWALDYINNGFGDVFSGYANGTTILNAANRWLGPNPREIAPGVWRSKVDPTRQFRMTRSDLTGSHGDLGPHCHFESVKANGRDFAEVGHVALTPDESADSSGATEATAPDAMIDEPAGGTAARGVEFGGAEIGYLHMDEMDN